jgi:predicted PurR-regulated permease PerM
MADDPGSPPDQEQHQSSSSPPAWTRLHLWQIQWVRDVLIGLLVFALFWLGQEISIVTVPLLLAILLAYLFEPVIAWLVRRTKLSRPGAVGAIIGAVIIGVLVPTALGVSYGAFQAISIVGRTAEKTPLVLKSVQSGRSVGAAERAEAEARRRVAEAQAKLRDQAEDAPTPKEVADLEADVDFERTAREAAEQKAREDLDQLEANAPRWVGIRDFFAEQNELGGLDEALEVLDRWIRANAEQIAGAAAAAGANVVERTLKFFAGAFGLLFMIFLTSFFFFFCSTGWVGLKGFGVKLLPDNNRDLILHLLKEFDRVISAFIRGRLTIAFIQSIVFTVGYFIIGVPAAFILGPIVAVLSIVPYLALVGVPISIVLIWMQPYDDLRGHWLWIVGAPTVFYFIAQALDDYVWTPWIQGKSTDMSTPMILFASLAGGVLFGVFGLLIAIPIAACIKILIQEVVWPRFKAWTEGRASDFLPIASRGAEPDD